MTTVIETRNYKYQFLPPLADEEYASLKADIAERGVLVPIEKDEGGSILDGHHRDRACQELRAEGVSIPDPPVIIRSGMTELEKKRHSIALNIARRHLGKEQRDQQIIVLRQTGMSTRAIADMVGADHSTIVRSGGAIAPPDYVKGKDGKSYPSRKAQPPKSVMAFNRQEESKALESVNTAGDSLPDKVITAKRAGRIAREVVADEKRQNAPVIPEPSILGADLRIGDFREKLVDVPLDSVSLICTDPPYNKNNIQLWKDLAIFAKRVLRPGGWLATYSGQSHLDQVISLLASELTYVWVIAQINTASAKNLIHHAHIYSCWKPILLFCKPPLSPITWANDLINGGGKDKNLHDWQQAISEAVYCIESFSTEGSLVVDPFLGSGTTALAAKQTNRTFIGCDLDAANISNAIERLKQCK